LAADAKVVCPRSLAPDSGSPGAVLTAVRRAAPHLLNRPGEHPYHVVALASLYPFENMYTNTAWITTARKTCGPRVASHSWAVLAIFPYWIANNRGAALSQALLYAANTPHGWTVWLRA
jgi:hypothetical protein